MMLESLTFKLYPTLFSEKYSTYFLLRY